jgi:hypothetical protein
VRVTHVHAIRCFVCRSIGLPSIAYWSYFSYARGRWWRVAICAKCKRELLAIIDARRHKVV